MRVFLIALLGLAVLVPSADALTIRKARHVTHEWGEWSMRTDDTIEYRVGSCWRRQSGRVRCRLKEHWPESKWLPEGWASHKIQVTRREGGRLCAHSTFYVERPKRYDCR